MIIRALTGKLTEALITSSKPRLKGQARSGGKVNKKRDNRNRRNQKEHNNRDYYRVKGRERKNTCEVRHRPSNQNRSCGRQSGMARLKKTHRKRNPPWEGSPEQFTAVNKNGAGNERCEGTFQTLVAPKGKETITRWEKELKDKCKGKAWDALVQEADWVTDLGATQPRETLYHKTVEMAWLTKMMIGKVISEREEARQEDNKENKTMLDEILRRINSLETITKLLVEVEKDQKCKLEQLAAQFHLYLRYVHHMDITPAMDTVHQLKSGRLARPPRRKITRARRMAGRSTPRCRNTS
jgi:hypothetical protein